MGTLTRLECPECGETFAADIVQTVCERCDSPLLARYNLPQIAQQFDRDTLTNRPAGMWRWAELLPVADPEHRITLGEGDTPTLRLPRLGAQLGLEALYLKDEGGNPTGTFKARGMAVAVSRARELGVEELAAPTAGNAGGALAAYAARARMPAHVFMPADAPESNQREILAAGAQLELVDGMIDEAGKQAHRQSQSQGWMNLSTFREPYRVEGKKTMGFELAEEFDWELPEILIYPTGGGTGLVGIWKAFEELEALGWIDSRRPRMVSVQADGCAPVVKAMDRGVERMKRWKRARTMAPGLRVPKPYADRLILGTLRESGGTAVAVSDADIQNAQADLASQEGVLVCPEGAACLAGLRHLINEGEVSPQERVLLLNTGSGLKYLT